MTHKNASTWRAQPRLLRPSDLAMAPELAALAIVEDALQTALVALVAAHPTLEDFAAAGEAPPLRRARRLVAAAATLDRVMERYRDAIYDALDPRPPLSDDLPF